MADTVPDAPRIQLLAREMLGLVRRARERAEEDPSGNPVASVALAITRRMDQGRLTEAELAALVAHLRDLAFRDRARRLARYGGAADGAADRFAALAAAIARPDPAGPPVPYESFAAAVGRVRFAAVFTAHPTFSLPAAVAAALAATASGETVPIAFATHRPAPITLAEELAQAAAAIRNGRAAIDALTAALLAQARACWPDRAGDLVPRPVILASWVGYDTDGRTDLGWWDVLRMRLEMKAMQLERVERHCAAIPAAAALTARAAVARAATEAQLAACPTRPDPDAVVAFAAALDTGRARAMTTPAPLLALFPAAMAAADAPGRQALEVVRAGLIGHGLALAHTHMRLNAAQIHNAARLRLGLEEPPADPSRRRVLLASINAALEEIAPQPVDFGALLVEQASAVRLMMAVAQILRFIDGETPVRFLIAETETGYTLLACLWLAKLFGIAERIEISPLFETAEALTQGARVIEEALRSPHWRAYLRATGRMCLQFGYSDSGRYVGQLAASYLIERLRFKLAELLARHGLADIELVLFDTHGESIGRGGHPGSLADRLDYLSPPASRRAFRAAGVTVREESAFQGGDGYLLFGTPALAGATIATIAAHALAEPGEATDPIYDDPDFAADFFATSGAEMQILVEDPGYAALLGAIGPALIDRTGSRPAARQTDGMGGPAIIRHPRELRAIPNNAILQQIGWCANTLHGLGAAAARQPEPFAELRARSPRFRRALDLAAHGLAHSDLDALRAMIATLDPGTWLDRAGHPRLAGRQEALIAVAEALERLGLAPATRAMFRRIQLDHLHLRAAWPDLPRMETRELLLHSVRLALIQRIWLLAAAIPDFSPRHGVSRGALFARILLLDVPAALDLLDQIFPEAPDPAVRRHFAAPDAAHARTAYAREHAEIFMPMRRLFALVREIGVAISHEVGAFG